MFDKEKQNIASMAVFGDFVFESRVAKVCLYILARPSINDKYRKEIWPVHSNPRFCSAEIFRRRSKEVKQ